MAPQVLPLPRSESKTRFFARIGLDIRLALHRQLYTLMKAEASEGRRRIISALIGQPLSYQYFQQTGTPRTDAAHYSTSSIDEATFNAEAARILLEAQPATRIIYNLAFDPVNPSQPNWIIRWMLWHVFRYRDGRQKGQSIDHTNISAREESSDDEDSNPRGDAAQGSIQPGCGGSGSGYYDPARNTWSPASSNS